MPMFPWYSGTSADMYKTMVDLTISVKLFLGRFDMRTMQASWRRHACTSFVQTHHPQHYLCLPSVEHMQLWKKFVSVCIGCSNCAGMPLQHACPVMARQLVTLSAPCRFQAAAFEIACRLPLQQLLRAPAETLRGKATASPLSTWLSGTVSGWTSQPTLATAGESHFPPKGSSPDSTTCCVPSSHPPWQDCARSA